MVMPVIRTKIEREYFHFIEWMDFCNFQVIIGQKRNSDCISRILSQDHLNIPKNVFIQWGKIEIFSVN